MSWQKEKNYCCPICKTKTLVYEEESIGDFYCTKCQKDWSIAIL